MDTMQNQNNDSLFWDFVINAAVIVAAIALYSKTQEVMTALAPATLFGQKGLALIYGFGVAALIEGVTLALHFLKRFDGNVRAEGYKWFLFGISTFCQFLDESLVKDTASRTEMEAFFAFVALGIVPAIFFGLLWVKGGSSKAVGSRGQWNGLIPTFRNFLYGSPENTRVSSNHVLPDVRQTKKVSSRNSRDQQEEEVNPK